MEKMRPQKTFIQDHTASKQNNWDPYVSTLFPDIESFTTKPYCLNQCTAKHSSAFNTNDAIEGVDDDENHSTDLILQQTYYCFIPPVTKVYVTLPISVKQN